ncbi:MAG: tol-pal system YbgF family protein [Cyclobacteriaceae bacterium]
MAKNKKGANENEETIVSQLSNLEEFIQKNTNAVYAIAAVVVIAAAGYFFWTNKVKTDTLEAQKELFTAQYFFAQDSIGLVLNGDGNSVIGVEEIAEEYSSTDAGNLSNFYSGALYLKQGEYETAIEFLDKFSSSDFLVQARAYALTGDAYMELGEYDNAATQYEKAADHYPNETFTPAYLNKLALAYEKADNQSEALEVYSTLLKDYPNSSEATRAKKYKALLATK